MHCIWLPEYNGNNTIILSEAEAHHVMHVLRAKAGEQMRFTNGKGTTGLLTIEEVNKKQCRVAITETTTHSIPAPEIHVGLSVLHNADRMRFAIEKLTELGVRTITPLSTRHTEKKHFNATREYNHIIAAVKQSAQAFAPELKEMVQFLQWIKQEHNENQRFIAHCQSTPLPPLALSIIPQQPVLILIGPEGDFNAEEVALAEAHGFRSVSLGNDVLRSETAAVTAVVTIKTLSTLHA